MPKTNQRAIWSGAITFGLVTIPVKLYAAVREEDIHFHMLHDQDNARLKRKLVCSVDDKEVHPEHIVKAYEISPDQYVIIDESELEAVQPKKSRTVAIEDFVDLAAIDPIYYDRPYYLLPDETGLKPYALLVEAMTRSKRVAIARFVMRSKEYLGALRPVDGTLVMETMHFDSEVVPLKDMEPSAPAKIDERELKMAGQLIDALYGKFDPGKYKDEYAGAVREMIERKAAGEKIVSAPEAREGTKTSGDLMGALEASLARARRSGGSESKTNPDGAAASSRRRTGAKKR